MWISKMLAALASAAYSAFQGKERAAKAKAAHDAELARAREVHGEDPPSV